MAQTILGVMTLYVYNRQIEELSFFRKMSLLGEPLGIQVIVFTPEDIAPKKKLVFAHIYDKNQKKWLRQWMPLPKLIFDRCRYQKTSRFQLLKLFRGKYNHLTYLNRPMMHKWGNHKIMEANKKLAPYLPETALYNGKEDLSRFLKKHPIVYLKPENGTGGRGIISIHRSRKGLFFIRGRSPSRKITKPVLVQAEKITNNLKEWPLQKGYLIQQGIDITLADGRVHDFRLLMQKNGKGEWEATGSAGRIGPRRSVTSNLHGGGVAMATQQLLKRQFNQDTVDRIRTEMESLGHEIVLHLEKHFKQLCEMALDIAVDRKGRLWLLEVNPKPAREVFRRIGEKETYTNAIKRPLEYALWLDKNNS